jgi:hypothetical protein
MMVASVPVKRLQPRKRYRSCLVDVKTATMLLSGRVFWMKVSFRTISATPGFVVIISRSIWWFCSEWGH